MKAAVATGAGDVDRTVFVRDDWPVPSIDRISERKTKDKEMLIRILTCALAPGNPRILSGATYWIQLPRSGHPYVIGSDVAGLVMQVEPKEEKLHVGYYVVSRFELPGHVERCCRISNIQNFTL
jgi:NADPH:quinone reductase-like Zn-dependent oxidoreductase